MLELGLALACLAAPLAFVGAWRLICLAAVLVVAGCGGGGGGGGGEDTETRCRQTLPVSVSVVNGWPGLDPFAYAEALRDSCLSVVEIEALPWFDRSGLCDARHPILCTEPFPIERRVLFEAMARAGVSVFVNVHNANAIGPRLKPRSWYAELVSGILRDATETGADVWLSPISEPWTWESGEARARAVLARSLWPGKFVLPDAGANRRTGRPFWGGIAYDLLEVHPCSLEQARGSIHPDTLTVTDCGPILNPGPEVAVELATLARDAAAALLLYDHAAFDLDLATTNALAGLARE